MQVARAVTEGSCRPRTSIIFVAFDLEEMGCIGSFYFVRNFLIPTALAVNGAKLKGSCDSIFGNIYHQLPIYVNLLNNIRYYLFLTEAITANHDSSSDSISQILVQTR